MGTATRDAELSENSFRGGGSTILPEMSHRLLCHVVVPLAPSLLILAYPIVIFLDRFLYSFSIYQVSSQPALLTC